ncbi:MAG: poly-gamma-glutamate biosynthesis protein PgsC/CapC [Deltaproteobacteria bacterium]|nr:poly-gamma-glutamate biosynthesis protein PgsC/CapC [Deltaproteobacteria bacterium]
MFELFPDQLLDISIHTAVLVGILTLWLFTERLGWVFAGFVVPGYLVAIGIVAPLSLVAIVLEAVVTYGLVWLIGEGAGHLGAVARVFGRDRFLAFILVSVPVRIVVEGFAASELEVLFAPWLGQTKGAGGGFFGIGVVLVPLLANVFWKPGLARGLFQVAVSTGVAWLLLAGVLMPLTNFHFAGFEAVFDDVALDFLVMSKVYMVLLATTFVAARNSLRFGWDFAGILVPALLAIVAFDPLKLVATVIEILVLAGVYSQLVRLPWIRGLNLGGPRRVVSMYTLAYLLKYLGAVVGGWVGLDFQVADVYGFGYLLTSLVALRCWQAGAPGKVLFPLLWTTGQGLFLGLGLSLFLSRALPDQLPPTPEHEPLEELTLERAILGAGSSVLLDAPRHRRRTPSTESMLRSLAELADSTRLTPSLPLRQRLGASGLRLGPAVRSDGSRCFSARSLPLEERAPTGTPSVWWCGGNGPVLYVPYPTSDPDSLVVAAILAHASPVAGVIVEGVDPGTSGNGTRPQPRHWAPMRRRLGDRPVLVVFTDRPEEAGAWIDPRSSATAESLAGLEGPLGTIPLRFDEFDDWQGELWNELRLMDGFLSVTPAAAARLVPPRAEERALLDDVLADDAPLPRLTARRSPIDAAERDRSLAAVLALALRSARVAPAETLPLVAHVAQGVGLRTLVATDAEGAEHWVIEAIDEEPAGWGRWVVRPGGGEWVVGGPRDAEEEGVAAVAAHLYHSLEARALWLARRGTRFGDHGGLPSAHDTDAPQTRVLRESLRPLGAGASEPLSRLLLVRRATTLENLRDAVVLSSVDLSLIDRQRVRTARKLGGALDPWPGVTWRDGSAGLASMAVASMGPMRYMDSLRPGRSLVAWFLPDVLEEVRGHPTRDARLSWYADQGVPVRRMNDVGLARDPDRAVELDLSELALLQAHADLPTFQTLRALRRGTRGQVEVLVDPLRVTVATRRGNLICATVAGAAAPGSEPGGPGCWTLP